MVNAAYLPEGFHTITPYVVVDNATAALDFYARAFGAKILSVRSDDRGRILHAELQVGDSPIMLAEEFTYGALTAKTARAFGGASMHLYLYVPDVDALYEQAIAAGARQLMPVTDQPYGDRSGGVIDPFGHVWWLATLVNRPG
jgi:PhnB protein